MSIHRSTFNPVSHNQPSAHTTRDASKSANSATKFTRPLNDLAPGAGAAFPGFPDIDPNAPEAEKQLFDAVNDVVLGGSLPLIGLRLTNILKREGNQESRHEEFTFRNEPASIQVMFPRMVIRVGSTENGTAGQLSLVNGKVESMKGEVMQDLKVRENVMQHAGFAIGANIARQKNMPFAAATLLGRLNATMLLDEHGVYNGS